MVGLNVLPRPCRASGMASTLAPRRFRVAVVSAVVLSTFALSACGKTISITDKDDQAQAPAPVVTTPPPATTAATIETTAPGDQVGSNAPLQVVNNTAAQSDKNGTGGTVIGLVAQETPPIWVQLSAVRSPALSSPYLININQAALYWFAKDTKNPSTSNCNDACATKWPPVTIKQGGNVYLAGVKEKDIAAIRRKDGDVQITVGGSPIYRFSGDSKPGDLNGQGVGGTWFAVGPDGKPVMK